MRGAGIAVLLSVGWGFGQSSLVREPRLGLVSLEDGSALHPIFGIPGAAVVGEPLVAPEGWRVTAVSPLQEFALVAAARGSLRLWDLRTDPARIRPLPGGLEGIERVALSPTGSSALLAGIDPPVAHLLTGLPDSPRLAGRIDLSPLPSAPAAFALSDDARAVVAIAPLAGGHALYRLAEGEAPVLLAALGQIPAMAFLDRGHDLALVDRENNQIALVRDVMRDAEWLRLAGPEHGLLAPFAVRPFPDGNRLAVLHSDPSAIAVVDRAGGGVTSVACECVPQVLERLGPRAVFRLTAASSAPIWLLDGDAAEPRALFVPARRPAGAPEEVRP